MIFLIWIAALLATIIFYIHRSYSRFKDHGVKNPPVVPFLGNMSRLVLRIEDFSRDMNRYFKDYPEERFVGRFEFFRPVVFVKDLELAKKITLKDFEHFLDHRRFAAEDEPLFSRNLLSLKGQEWKDMRSTLSPAFTSSKIKLMVPFMEQAGEQMIRVLKKKIKTSETGSVDIDCKDLTARYASDVIASCAFGLKTDSHANENNEFHEKAMVGSAMKLRQQLVILIMSACPILAKILKLTYFSKETKDFFIGLVSNTMKDRETRNIVRPDMIHLLMEAKRGRHLTYDEKNTSSSENGSSDRDAGFATVEESSIGKRNIERVWSEIDLFAQATLFFIAGFETVSTSMAFALHELALNPDVQNKLSREIKENDAKYGGKLNYAGIQHMPYLDMVVSDLITSSASVYLLVQAPCGALVRRLFQEHKNTRDILKSLKTETLRKWPPNLAQDRVCSKDYNMGKPNAKSTKDYIIRKGEIVLIPTWGFHRDPKYFPEPETFDPERFSDENKHKINLMAYMPFGQGPRNCIGSRFALSELKIFLYHILLHIEVSPSVKTQLPSRLSPECFNPRLVGGHWLTFKARA